MQETVNLTHIQIDILMGLIDGVLELQDEMDKTVLLQVRILQTKLDVAHDLIKR